MTTTHRPKRKHPHSHGPLRLGPRGLGECSSTLSAGLRQIATPVRRPPSRSRILRPVGPRRQPNKFSHSLVAYTSHPRPGLSGNGLGGGEGASRGGVSDGEGGNELNPGRISEVLETSFCPLLSATAVKIQTPLGRGGAPRPCPHVAGGKASGRRGTSPPSHWGPLLPALPPHGAAPQAVRVLLDGVQAGPRRAAHRPHPRPLVHPMHERHLRPPARAPAPGNASTRAIHRADPFGAGGAQINGLRFFPRSNPFHRRAHSPLDEQSNLTDNEFLTSAWAPHPTAHTMATPLQTMANPAAISKYAFSFLPFLLQLPFPYSSRLLFFARPSVIPHASQHPDTAFSARAPVSSTIPPTPARGRRPPTDPAPGPLLARQRRRQQYERLRALQPRRRRPGGAALAPLTSILSSVHHTSSRYWHS